MPRSEARLAEARCRAYGLFGAIAIDGVTKDVVGHLDAVSGLDAAATPWRCDAGFDFEAAAAEHYRVLSHEVFPFASVFVDPSAMPGGAPSDRVGALYARIGFVWDPRGPSPDHVGRVLQAMAFLCGAEADAATDGRANIVARVRQLQTEVLDVHLLRWWPAFAEALAWGDYRFHRAWSEAVTELIVHHRGDLTPVTAAADEAWPAGQSLDDALNIDATGLADIAETLLVPARAGAFLSRGTIRSMSRSEGLPAGFGARRVVLSNLLRSASTYDAWARLVEKLRVRFAAARAFYAAFGALAAPCGGAGSEGWAARCARTEAGLERLKQVDGAGGVGGPVR